MLEAILHAASLAAFGQALRETQPDDLLRGMSERSPFCNVETHGFIRASKSYGGGSIASLPGQFLRRLAKEDLVSIRLTIPSLSRDMARAMPAGERTSPHLVTEGGAGIEAWTPEWTLKSRGAEGAKWAVEYVATRGTRQWNAGPLEPKAAEARLFDALGELSLAFEATCQNQWAKRLSALPSMRDQRWTAADRFGDALPTTWPATHRQLLGNAVRAWTMLSSSEFLALELDDEVKRALQLVWDAIRVGVETGTNLPVQNSGQRAA